MTNLVFAAAKLNNIESPGARFQSM